VPLPYSDLQPSPSNSNTYHVLKKTCMIAVFNCPWYKLYRLKVCTHFLRVHKLYSNISGIVVNKPAVSNLLEWALKKRDHLPLSTFKPRLKPSVGIPTDLEDERPSIEKHQNSFSKHSYHSCPPKQDHSLVSSGHCRRTLLSIVWFEAKISIKIFIS
jgi:hypothetical protein